MQGVDVDTSVPVDPRLHRALAGVSRVQVLEVLRAQSRALTVTDIARCVGLHPNTVRLHLDHLAGAGLATRQRERRDRPGRPRLFYAAVPEPERSDDPERGEEHGYRLLAEILASHLARTAPQPAAEATAAGRAWGRVLADQLGPTVTPTVTARVAAMSVREATEDLVGLLDVLGFAPQATGRGETIELHRCPFRQVAERQSPVVCGVHLGLMQGALAGRAAPMQATDLEPFVTPQLCLAHFDTGSAPDA